MIMSNTNKIYTINALRQENLKFKIIEYANIG